MNARRLIFHFLKIKANYLGEQKSNLKNTATSHVTPGDETTV